jgi:hypothetical protein
MNTIQGVTFEKDTSGVNRYIRIDMMQHAEALRPFMQSLGIISFFEGWEEGLTSEEFLKDVKKMLQKKFDDKNQISQKCSVVS